VKNGSLYGTTEAGGTSGAGIVFKLTPPPSGQTAWIEKILYSFSGGSDGGTPSGGLLINSTGDLYGMTSAGGLGFGTIYRLSHPAIAGSSWTETVLYTFSGGSDGANPLGNLVFDTLGALYGTASSGGTGHCGTVFQLSPPSTKGDPWMFALLYALAGVPDGCDPRVGVTLGKQPSVLYGTTSEGGASSGVGLGTVFRLTAPVSSGAKWNETVLHRFTETSTDGGLPLTPLFLRNGILYGATEGGGPSNDGTVFALLP
jgi:uncharacterized repeat protein (TIGR03803 family)